MSRWLACGAWCLAVLSAPVLAQPQNASYWLGRVVTAEHQLSYSGTFVFQSGSVAETSRIAHLVRPGGVLERIEVLDGSPREVIRDDNVVKYYLPGSHTLIIEKRTTHRTFPGLLPAVLGGLNDYYTIREGSRGRIAGRESQSIVLDPKDDLRYGHELWVDRDSGLLLKTEVMNEHDRPVETFTFTELQIGSVDARKDLRSKFITQTKGWHVQNMSAKMSPGADAGWQFKVKLPGFTRLAGMMRQVDNGRPDSLHLVFSDGLAAISVFIEPTSASAPTTAVGTLSLGATHVYERTIAGHDVVIMGEVPLATLKMLGNGIAPKNR